MTNFENVWGGTGKGWSFIDYRRTQLLTALQVIAWLGMILFFVFGAFTWFTQTSGATIAMVGSLGVWLAAGISAIRIRRGRRRFLTIPPSSYSKTSR